MVKKIIVLVLCFAILSTLFVGCGSQPAEKDTASTIAESTATNATESEKEDVKKVSGEIQFLTYRDDLLNTYYPKALEDFNTKFPDVKITTATSKNYEPDIKVKMASNDLPDVFTINSVNFSDAQRKQYMLPLDDSLPDLVKAWQSNEVSINADDKKTYALTFGLLSIGLAYNKKMFNELGLQAPKTLDELIAAGLKIKQAGKIGFVGCFKPVWTLTPYWNIAQAMMDNEVDTYNKWMNSDAPFTIDTSLAKIMDVIVKLKAANIMEDDPLSYDWEPYLKDFGSGKSGMALTWTSIPAQFPGRGDGSVKLEDIGMVPFPYDNSGGPYKVQVSADWGLAINASSKNLEAAKAFYKWHMDDNYGSYAAVSSVIPAKKGIVSDVPYLKEFDAANPVKVSAAKIPTEFKSFIDKIQMDFFHQYADVAAGISTEKELEKMNAMWKKGLGK